MLVSIKDIILNILYTEKFYKNDDVKKFKELEEKKNFFSHNQENKLVQFRAPLAFGF